MCDIKGSFYNLSLAILVKNASDEENLDFKKLWHINLHQAYLFIIKIIERNEIKIASDEETVIDNFYWTFIN